LSIFNNDHEKTVTLTWQFAESSMWNVNDWTVLANWLGECTSLPYNNVQPKLNCFWSNLVTSSWT